MSDLPNLSTMPVSALSLMKMVICIFAPNVAMNGQKMPHLMPKKPKIIRDANGNELADGDTVTVIKDLKLKGSSLVIKVGTKVKNIRLVEGDHDIDCKVDGIGAMKLKSEFVKKV
jgi:alkylphosphonate utilization operon protein PhnA